MLGLRHAPALGFLLLSAAVGATPQVPTAESVRLPGAPVQPAPAPDAAVKLTPDVFYVVDSDIPLLVLSSPAGLVSVTEDVGPVKIRGKFVGGTGRTETKTFTGKSVFTVEAVSTGRVELLIIPVGTKSATDVIRRTLDVQAGTGPQPPPTPVDPKPPEPKPPEPKPDPFALAIKAAYDAEPAADKKANTLALASLYKRAATQTVGDPTVKTYADLFADMKAASRVLLPETAIPSVRKAIGSRLNAEFSKPTDPIDRTKAAAEFAAVAAALEGATK